MAAGLSEWRDENVNLMILLKGTSRVNKHRVTKATHEGKVCISGVLFIRAWHTMQLHISDHLLLGLQPSPRHLLAISSRYTYYLGISSSHISWSLLEILPQDLVYSSSSSSSSSSSFIPLGYKKPDLSKTSLFPGTPPTNSLTKQLQDVSRFFDPQDSRCDSKSSYVRPL